MRVYRFFFVLSLSIFSLIQASVPNNLFDPYDILLYKPFAPGQCFEFSVFDESAFKSFGFQTDPDDRASGESVQEANLFRRRVTPMQLWQDSQNFCAALSGADADSPLASHASLLNIKGQQIECGLEVGANIAVPLNLILTTRFALPYNLIFAFYVPVMTMELKNVHWKHKQKDTTTFASRLDNFIDSIERLGNVKTHKGWHKTSIGDCSAAVWWSRYFPQYKPLLKGVMTRIRGGTIFPTGAKASSEILFDIPFGHGQGFGMFLGGTLELNLGYYATLGIDGEFSHFLGSSGKRRLQTSRGQTDLLFLNHGDAYLDPGLLQHYTLYLKSGIWKGWSTTLAYQHSRQQESFISPALPIYESTLINDAESIQNWTTHSMVWFVNYDPPGWQDCSYFPRISGFVKNGFNGKRALLFDTAGFQLSLSY